MFLDEMAAGEPQRRWPEWLTATSSCPKIRCSVVSNCASSAKLDAATYLNWSERQCGRPLRESGCTLQTLNV